MGKKILLLIPLLILGSCLNPLSEQKKEVTNDKSADKIVKPVVKASASSENEATAKKYEGLLFFDKEKKIYCSDVQEAEQALYLPNKLVVSDDGSKIFANTESCFGVAKNLPKTIKEKFCDVKYPVKDKNIVPANYIYRVDKERNLKIIKDKEQPFYSCNPAMREIATDGKDNLYFVVNDELFAYQDQEQKLSKVTSLVPDGKDLNIGKNALTLSSTGNKLTAKGGKLFFYSEYGTESKNTYFHSLDKNNLLLTLGEANGKTLFAPFKNNFYVFIGQNIKSFTKTEKYFRFDELPKELDDETKAKYDFGNLHSLVREINLTKSTFYKTMKVNSKGEIFINDFDQHVIWKIIPGQKLAANKNREVFAGQLNKPGYNDGYRADALFNYPADLAIDSSDNIYVSDMLNHTIRKISPDGIVSTYFRNKEQ